MNKYIGSLIVLVLLSSLVSCELSEVSLPVADIPEPESDRGALVLVLSGGLTSAKTLAPPIEMEIGSYDIRGEGPNPLTDNFEDIGNTTGTLTLAGLTAGIWTITVDARNPDVVDDPNRNGTIIGYGKTNPPILISPGLVTSIQIEVLPVEGTGTLELTLNWTMGAYTDPYIDAFLTLMGSSTTESLLFFLTPRNNPKKGKYNYPDRATGYYLLTLQLRAETGLIWGTMEAVRIIEGQITSQTYTVN